MARPNMNQRGLVSLPRNWRVITVASLTTLGLAYGAGQPVRGEWWSLPKAKSEATKASVAKPVATENGFSSTIHRLMSDARLYAEKGDFDKAVQLAERAAKISEASSQLLGPAADCSPEKTAQFANDLRLRRDAVAKRTAPTRVAPAVAVVAPKARSTTPRSREIPPESPPQLLESHVEERVVAERVLTEPPAEMIAESRESQLAWAEDLPPTPAPEPESLNKPIKFRRSVLARAGHSLDEEADDSRTIAEETESPSSANSMIAEMLDTEFTGDGLPSESPPAVSETVTIHTSPSLNETVAASSAEANLPSFNGEIQPVAVEAPTHEPPPPPAVLGSKSRGQDEAFAEELLLGKRSSAKSDGFSTESASAVTKVSASPFPEEGFPVQRVVQLRRRLETVASLNPGGAYMLPASPSTESVREVSRSATLKSETPSTPNPARAIESPAQTEDWMTSVASTEHAEKQADYKSEPTPKERQVVRLREHRVLPDHVRAALLQAAALPAAPAARKRVVGYSAPMLWQSASESDSVLPALSLANGIGSGTSGSHNAAGASLPPDLRDPALLAKESGHVHRVASATAVEQTGFRSHQRPADSNQLIEPGGLALSASDKGVAKRAPSDTLRSLDSKTPSSRTANRSAAAGQKPQVTKFKASHEVSRLSFAVIESLASALRLPHATTAALLGGTGLAMLGLGLLLARAAIRWRHS